MGSLGGALWVAVIVVTTIAVPSGLILIRNARELNVLLLGENEARYLGVDAERLKRTIVICTALCVGAAISVSGVIGFVGLVVPHLVRLTLGPDHRRCLGRRYWWWRTQPPARSWHRRKCRSVFSPA